MNDSPACGPGDPCPSRRTPGHGATVATYRCWQDHADADARAEGRRWRCRVVVTDEALLVLPRDMGDMPNKRGDRAHKAAEKRARRERRRLARDEQVREDHARLVADRSQDPRFTQRIHRPDGTTVYQWPADSPQDTDLREMMERQAGHFRDKFGRDPGPEDPLFFDPDADEPRPRDLDTVTREMTEGLRTAGTEAGVDPALIEAWCELGYVVTEDNQHLFSANDIAAWNETVRRHAGDLNEDADLNDEEEL
jgi:hypothetical protein